MTVAQSRRTLCHPIHCSLPGSSVHGILQARILKWVAIPFSRGPSQSRDQAQVSCIAGRYFTIWATREAPGNFPLFRKITWGEGRLVSKNQLWRFCSTMNFLKEDSLGERLRILHHPLCVDFPWLFSGDVTVRCFRDLVLSLKLPSSTWMGALVPTEELKDTVTSIPLGETRTLPPV